MIHLLKAAILVLTSLTACTCEDCFVTTPTVTGGSLDSSRNGSNQTPTYAGPPVVSAANITIPGSSASWRPVLVGDQAFQFVSGTASSAYQGLIRVTPVAEGGDRDAVGHRYFESIANPYLAASPKGTLVAPGNLGIYRIPLGSLVALGPSLGGFAFKSDPQGETWLGVGKAQEGLLRVILMDPESGDTTHLFDKGVDVSIRSMGVRHVMRVVEADGREMLYGLVTFYQTNIDGSPSWCFRYDLNAHRLEWLNVYDIATKAENAQSMGVYGDLVLHKGWHSIIAYDRTTGEERWRYARVPNRDINIGGSPIMFGGGRAYFFEDSGWLLAIDLEDGREVWRDRTATTSVIAAQHWREEKYVFVSMGDSHLNLFDAGTGRYILRWRSPNHNLKTDQIQFNWDGFSAYPERGLVAAQDWQTVWVFDLSQY